MEVGFPSVRARLRLIDQNRGRRIGVWPDPSPVISHFPLHSKDVVRSVETFQLHRRRLTGHELMESPNRIPRFGRDQSSHGPGPHSTVALAHRSRLPS